MRRDILDQFVGTMVGMLGIALLALFALVGVPASVAPEERTLLSDTVKWMFFAAGATLMIGLTFLAIEVYRKVVKNL